MEKVGNLWYPTKSDVENNIDQSVELRSMILVNKEIWHKSQLMDKVVLNKS
jgi:hypothetical protein